MEKLAWGGIASGLGAHLSLIMPSVKQKMQLGCSFVECLLLGESASASGQWDAILLEFCGSGRRAEARLDWSTRRIILEAKGLSRGMFVGARNRGPAPIVSHGPHRFAKSFHAHKQARKNRFSFEEGNFVKSSIRLLARTINIRTSERLKRSVKS
jgi:hypothetical protein